MNQQRQGTPGRMDEFPVMGPALGQGIYAPYPNTSTYVPGRNPSDIPLNLSPEDYGSYCDPDVRYISANCAELFPYASNSGQYQYGDDYNWPLGTAYNSVTQRRKPFPFFEWGAMGLFQVQYPDTQYKDTKSPYGIDKVYGPSFGEWVTGPWLYAITQEVYQQDNHPLAVPWGPQF